MKAYRDLENERDKLKVNLPLFYFINVVTWEEYEKIFASFLKLYIHYFVIVGIVWELLFYK